MKKNTDTNNKDNTRRDPISMLFGIFFLVLAATCIYHGINDLISFISGNSKRDLSDFKIYLFAIFIFTCIGILLINKRKPTKEYQAQLYAEKMQNFKGPTIHTFFHHVNGLPLAENILCEIFSYVDRIEFKAGTTNIKLAREKITDMCLKYDTEIQNEIYSSFGKAATGAVLFGPVGAIIGGRARNKKTQTITQYLIITYIGEQSEIKYIGFDTDKDSSAKKLVDEFHALNQNSEVQIEL